MREHPEPRANAIYGPPHGLARIHLSSFCTAKRVAAIESLLKVTVPKPARSKMPKLALCVRKAKNDEYEVA